MVKKVKTFFHNFVHSLIPQSGYYPKIIRSPFSFSLSYFLILIFILNLAFVISLIVKYNPPKINAVANALIESLNKYPDKLTINLHKGRLMTNYNQPYLFWLNYQNKQDLLLVIDESASPQKILQYKSYALITPQELVINNPKNNSISTLPLSYFDDYTINKQLVAGFTQPIMQFQKLLSLISIVFLLILISVLPLVSLIIMFIYIVMSSLVVFVLFKILAKKHFHFKKILQVSFHAATLPLLLDYLFIIFRPAVTVHTTTLSRIKQLPFPILFFVLLAIFIGAGVYEAYVEDKTHHAPTSPIHPRHKPAHAHHAS